VQGRGDVLPLRIAAAGAYVVKATGTGIRPVEEVVVEN